jgi:hypothetical protein
MKIMCKYLLISLITIFLLGCNHQKPLNQNGDYITIPINPKEALKTVNLSEIFSDIEYIPLESVDKHLIGEVQQVIVYKGRIYVFDRYQTQSVFCFQQDGKFLFELNRKGQGPGEYEELNAISIDHNNEHLLLYCHQKINVCDLDGKHIGSHRNDIWSHNFSYTDDGYAAFYGGFNINAQYAKNGMSPNLLIANTDDYKVENTDIFFSSKIKPSAVVGVFNCFSSYQNGTISLLVPYDDTVYHISKRAVERAYYIDFGDMKKDKSFYSLLRNPETKIDEIPDYEKEHDICSMRTLTESKTDIYFVYYHKRIFHFVFYNKDTKRVIDVCKDFGKENVNEYLPFDNDINGIPFVSIYSTDGESFYGVIDAFKIIKFKESIKQSNAVNKDKLLKMLEGINEFDNPVIVKMKLKK